MRKKVFSFKNILAIALAFLMVNMPLQALAAMSALEQRLLLLEEKMETQEKSFSWLKKFKPKADLRLRHEQLFRGSGNSTGRKFDRTRERIRFRIGGEYFFTKNLKAGFRLVTGSDELLDREVASRLVVEHPASGAHHVVTTGLLLGDLTRRLPWQQLRTATHHRSLPERRRFAVETRVDG